MSRSTKEWFGKSDDHRAPGTVRARVFDREKGICHLCSLTIQAPGQKWDLDHVVALINGGENRESNLKPAHRKCHKTKTAADVAEKAKIAAIRGRHIGASAPKSKIQSAGFRGKRERPSKPSLPARQLFALARPGTIMVPGDSKGD
jgi:5-methylcytosine-specific restriction protein A